MDDNPPRDPARADHGPARDGSLAQWLARPALLWVALAAAFALTLVAWRVSLRQARQEARARFEHRADELQARLMRRVAGCEAMLRGGAALFDADQGQVSRAAWHRFVDSLDMPAHFPGVQGLGLSVLIAPEQLAAHQQAVRADGFADYRVWPPGWRDTYSSVVYLEPFDARNRRAFGFDMLTESTRRAAMSRARDSGQMATTGVLRLVQDAGQRDQNGFLVFLPVYRGGARPDSDATRRAALWGWVYAPVRVGDLMAVLTPADRRDIAFQLHDGVQAVPGNLFYDSEAADAAARRPDALQQQRSLSFGGREWTVVYRSLGAGAAPDMLQPTLVAGAGVTINLLLVGMVGLLIRRRRQAEGEVLQRSDEVRSRTLWLDAVSSLSPDGVLVFERDAAGVARLVFTNPAFSQLFGLQPLELLGLSETAVDAWLAGLATDGAAMPPLAPGDVTLRLAGPPRRVLQRSQREEARQRVYYFSDVTRESEVDRLKGEFLTTAAHELRTPLASVYGFSELLLEPELPEARRIKVSQIVHRQAGVLKHLVDELLDLARIDARGDHDFVRERCDLREVADTAAESMLQPDQPSRIALALGPAALWALADAAKLRQALVNALSNAVKYSPDGSPITLDTLRELRDQVPWVGLRVTDHGIGMDAEQCARAFERFYRADPSGHILGAGLGLAITREVMALHGGEVSLRSQPGLGTTLTLWLPLLPALDEADLRAAAPPPDAAPAGAT